MVTEKLNLTKDAWVELLGHSGGSFLIQDTSETILLHYSESGVPALDAPALKLEEHQLSDINGFTNIPAGTSVWCRAQGAPTDVVVAR